VSVVETVVEAVRIIQTAMMTTAIDVRALGMRATIPPAQQVCEVDHTAWSSGLTRLRVFSGNRRNCGA
jgi:hypothetical protein